METLCLYWGFLRTGIVPVMGETLNWCRVLVRNTIGEGNLYDCEADGRRTLRRNFEKE